MPSARSEEVKADPNLTPMLDMVFQLITFFVMVTTFKSLELDTTLSLPVVGSARPVESQGRDVLVLNIDKTGNIKLRDAPIKDVEGYIAGQRLQYQLAEFKSPDFIDKGEELNTIVVVRADRATPFNMVYRVLKACQDNGFRQFALKALDKPAT